MANKFDELLTQLGTGKWNLVYFIYTGYWYFFLPAQTFNVVYLAPPMNYTCRPPDEENVTQLSEDSCSYTVNRTSSMGPVVKQCTEWDFDHSIYSSTLTSEFGLVCEKAYLRATYQSVYAFPTIFTSLISGYIADRYGRKTVVKFALTLYAVIAFLTCFLTNYNVILAFRVIMGSLSSPTSFMLSMEVCEVRQRSVVGILLGLPWAIGVMAWGGMGYLIRDWRWLQAAVSIPLLFVVFFFFFIDESPRWLIVSGRHEEALKVLRRAARLNNATLPPEEELRSMMNDIQKEDEVTTKKSAAKSKAVAGERKCCSFRPPPLLRTPKIRLITLVLGLNFFTCSLVYSGLNLSGSTYSTDPFLYMVIGGLMEVPANTLTAPIIHHWGRKRPFMIGWIISGASLLSLAFVPSDISWLEMSLAMIGKLAVSSNFMIVLVYGAELLPTEVRLQGTAVVFVAEKIAATFSPYLTDFLSPIVPWLPSSLFGVMSLLTAASMIPLPETKGRAMPDTIADLEDTFSKKKRDGQGDESEMENLQD